MGDPHHHFEEVILAPTLVIAVGALIRHLLLLTGLPIPYTINLLLVGFVTGLCLQEFALKPLKDAVENGNCQPRYFWDGAGVGNFIGPLQRSFVTLAELDPHLLLHIFLPPLIYESASAIEWHVFYQLKWAALLLAVPGVIASTYLLGALTNALYGAIEDPNGADFAWPSSAGNLLGVILSATDPVAVVALLKDLGVKEELAIGIEAESLFNDGTALVFFQVLMSMVQVPPTKAPTFNEVVGDLLYKGVFGAFWGVCFGVLTTMWVSFIFNNPVIEITVTLSAAYLSFFSAEAVGCSGVLAVVALGLFMGKEGRIRISPEVGHFLHEFWEMLAFFGNTVIFVIAGLVMTYRLDITSGVGVTAEDYGVLMVLYAVSTVTRLTIVLLVWWFESLTGRNVDWRDALVTTWGGLRGAVGLALALMVFAEAGTICERVRQKILFHASGIVMLTVIVNSMTMRGLISLLRINEVPPERRLMQKQAIKKLLKASIDEEEHLQRRDLFATVVWHQAQKYFYALFSLDDLEGADDDEEEDGGGGGAAGRRRRRRRRRRRGVPRERRAGRGGDGRQRKPTGKSAQRRRRARVRLDAAARRRVALGRVDAKAQAGGVDVPPLEPIERRREPPRRGRRQPEASASSPSWAIGASWWLGRAGAVARQPRGRAWPRGVAAAVAAGPAAAAAAAGRRRARQARVQFLDGVRPAARRRADAAASGRGRSSAR